MNYEQLLIRKKWKAEGDGMLFSKCGKKKTLDENSKSNKNILQN